MHADAVAVEMRKSRIWSSSSGRTWEAQFALAESRPLPLPNFGCQSSTSNSRLGSTQEEKIISSVRLLPVLLAQKERAGRKKLLFCFTCRSHEPILTLCVPNRSFIRFMLSERFEQALEELRCSNRAPRRGDEGRQCVVRCTGGRRGNGSGASSSPPPNSS